jgi:hypothetical protein
VFISRSKRFSTSAQASQTSLCKNQTEFLSGTTRTRNCVSRATFLGLAFNLFESAEQAWRRIRAPEKIASLLESIPFKDGVPA